MAEQKWEVGQEVVRINKGEVIRAGTIVVITPTRIGVEDTNGDLIAYAIDGRESGRHESIRITPMTDEYRTVIARKALYREVFECGKPLTLDQLTRIMAILEEDAAQTAEGTGE